MLYLPTCLVQTFARRVGVPGRQLATPLLDDVPDVSDAVASLQGNELRGRLLHHDPIVDAGFLSFVQRTVKETRMSNRVDFGVDSGRGGNF